MNKENAFLPHFFDEEIYIIDEVVSKTEVQSKPIVEETKETYEAPKVAKDKQPQAELTYTGQNNKGVLLIVNTISSEESTFLEKVLNAVKFTMDDCALLDLSKNSSEQHHVLIEKFDCNIIINLGGQNLSFLEEVKNYKINFVADKKALQTDDLSSIMADVSKKKLLWECLQQLFL